MTDLLDRLPKESTKAHEAFVVYAKLGAKRSLPAVARKCRKSVSLIRRWSARNHWIERVGKWDARENSREIEADDKAKDVVALDAKRRQEQVQKEAWEWYQALAAKAREMLRFPVGRQEVVTARHKQKSKEHPEGLPMTTTVVEPTRWRFSDLAKMVELADSLGRLASGLPSKVTALADPTGQPFTIARDEEPLVVKIQFTDDDATRQAVAEFGELADRSTDAAS